MVCIHSPRHVKEEGKWQRKYMNLGREEEQHVGSLYIKSVRKEGSVFDRHEGKLSEAGREENKKRGIY